MDRLGRGPNFPGAVGCHPVVRGPERDPKKCEPGGWCLTALHWRALSVEY
jgi:hypothetical protein